MAPRALIVAVFSVAAVAQTAVPLDPTGIHGARILGGGGPLPPIVRERFIELAGGPTSHIAVVPTAGADVADDSGLLHAADSWRRDFPMATFTVVHTRDRTVADTEAFCAPLRSSSGVWFPGGVQERLADAYLGTRFETELMALCARGGVVGGTSAGTAIQSRTMIQEGMDPPILATGLDLVPGAIVDQHFSQRQRLPRLLAALTMHPHAFGLGVDESTAVEIVGRRLRTIGKGTATLALAQVGEQFAHTRVLRSGEEEDLVTWQRAARQRPAGPWPPTLMASPCVTKGALVLVGGGRLPDAVVRRFVALAGGAHARIVLVPAATPVGERGAEPMAQLCRAAGVAEVLTFDASNPAEVTPAQLARLDGATGIWFGGGRQWRLCDAFDGTPALAAFHAVLARGGVIGGSSAGATIQGEFLVRGNPLGNDDAWCEGYDHGFAFLPGCAVDQHFLTRNRLTDLQELITALPQLIGLGIDEGTAAIVQGPLLEVLGDSKIAVFDVRNADAPTRAAPSPTWLAAGARWDLVAGAPAK